MTLIIATLQTAGCLITADGASWKSGRVADHNVQKIFPVPGAPLAIYQFGRNELGGLPFGELADEFVRLRGSRLPSLAASRAAECAAGFFHPHAVVTIAGGSHLDIFVDLIGFGACCPNPHWIEAHWERPAGALKFSNRVGASILIIIGDAGNVIREYLTSDVSPGLGASGLGSHDLGYAVRLHDELYRLAKERGTKTCEPAGHRHRLRVTRLNGCVWDEPPLRSATLPTVAKPTQIVAVPMFQPMTAPSSGPSKPALPANSPRGGKKK